jgi:hypothetical protein
MDKRRGFWNMGTAIVFSTAGGIVLGALLGDILLWSGIGLCAGVVLGALEQKNRKNNNAPF